MSTEPSDDAVAHDAWLREALRHAPDSDIAPPAALREAILRQARATAAPARPVGALERFWRWFTQPMVATGFASLMVSAVLTLIWWGGEFEDEAARTRPTAQVPAAPQPQSEPAQVAEPSAPPADAGATAKLEKAAPAKRPLRTVQPPAAAPATAPAAPPQPPTERRADAPLAAQAPRSRDEAAPATAAALAAVDPLPHVATGAALRWTVAGSSHAHGSAQQAWFDRLRSATAGRWQRTGDVAREGMVVQLFGAAAPRGEFVLARDHVLWLDPARGAWRAPLAEADAAQLASLITQW